MSRTSGHPRWAGVVLAGATVLALATGCGEDRSPADSVPALSRQLDRVDAAIAAERYDDARTALDDLVDTTAQASADGTLDATEADAILQAAGHLTEQLQGAAGSPAPDPSSTSSNPSSIAPEETPVEPDDEGAPPHKEHGKGRGHAHGHDED